MQAIRLHGTSATLHKNTQLYHIVESEQDLIAWNDRNDTRIDKYDCRSLLDRIPEGPKKTEDEVDEEWSKSHTPAAKHEREIEARA